MSPTTQNDDSLAEKQDGEDFNHDVHGPPPVSAEPPDGGLDAWLTVLGASLVSVATFGAVNGFGAFNDYYKTTYLSNYSATLISMIGSIQLFILYAFAGIAGALFDCFGPRYMIPASGLISCFALLMLSISQPQQIYQQYLTQAVLFSLSATFAFFPALAVCAHWFKRRVAFAMSFPTAISSLGSIVYPVMFERAIPRIGFGWTIRILSLIALACYIAAAFTITTPRPPKPLPRLSQLITFRAFRDPSYTCLCLAAWLSVFSCFTPFFYVGLYSALGVGADADATLTPYNYLAIMGATAIVGRIGPALIADRVGRFNVISVSTTLAAVLMLALWYTSSAEPNLVAFSVLYGFTSGPFFSLTSSCVVQISPLDEVGARVGMLVAFMSTGALAGPPLAGVFIRDETLPNFRHLILFSGVMALVGSVFYWAARLVQSTKVVIVV
ncbi:major facilitator superfamily domain-containing protein [Mycena vulgaris]|nr:major facilitator superfamily domain-containing protein [Mycena vulgaris]